MSVVIRAVLFDAVGTLIYPEPSAVEVYFNVGANFGSRLSRGEVETRFYQAVRDEERADLVDGVGPGGANVHRSPTGEARELRRWQRIVQSVFADVPDAGGVLFSTLWDHFADSTNWRVFEDVPATLGRIQQLGLVLGIASNFDRRLVDISKSLEPLAACDHVFCSSMMGYPKPSPEFFRAAEKELKLRPSEILLVGDDWENDYQAATSAGWQAIHVDRSRPIGDARSAQSLQRVVEFIESPGR